MYFSSSVLLIPSLRCTSSSFISFTLLSKSSSVLHLFVHLLFVFTPFPSILSYKLYNFPFRLPSVFSPFSGLLQPPSGSSRSLRHPVIFHAFLTMPGVLGPPLHVINHHLLLPPHPTPFAQSNRLPLYYVPLLFMPRPTRPWESCATCGGWWWVDVKSPSLLIYWGVILLGSYLLRLEYSFFSPSLSLPPYPPRNAVFMLRILPGITVSILADLRNWKML